MAMPERDKVAPELTDPLGLATALLCKRQGEGARVWVTTYCFRGKQSQASELPVSVCKSKV